MRLLEFTSIKKIILISSLILNGWMYSQNVTEVAAKDLGMGDAEIPKGFFRNDEGDLYKGNRQNFSRENRAEYTLERYTETLKLKATTKIEFADDREFGEENVFVGNKILFFSSMFDGTNKNLYLRIIDKETGKVIADKKQFGALESDRFGNNARNFIIKTTPDKTKMVIISSFQWNKKPQQVNAVLYELPSLKEIGQYKFADNANGNLIKSHSYYLNSDGNLFYIFKEEQKDKDALPKETIALYDFKTKNTKYKFLAPSPKERDNTNVIVNNNMVYQFGRYIEKISKKEQYTGTFFFIYNLKDIDKVITNFEPYPTDIETKLSYKDGAGKRELSKKEISLTGSYKTNTGFFMVQNLTYKTESSGQYSTRTNYYSREFIVSKFNFEGKREFVKVIPKYTGKDMLNSDIVENNGNLYLFYCEHPKNLEKYTLENYDPAEYDDVGDIRGPVPVCVKVTADGKLSRQAFERNETWCYYPGYGLNLSNGTQVLSVRVEKNTYTPIVFKIKN